MGVKLTSTVKLSLSLLYGLLHRHSSICLGCRVEAGDRQGSKEPEARKDNNEAEYKAFVNFSKAFFTRARYSVDGVLSGKKRR